MEIVLTSDNIWNKDRDLQFLKDIRDKLKSKGYEAYAWTPVGPNSHNKVLESKSVKPDAFVVNIFGGADAGVILAYSQQWFKNIKQNRKVMPIWIPPSTDITGLKWLPRAWDDNYSPKSFKGINNPVQFLKDNGYSYAYCKSVDDVVNSILKEIGGNKVTIDISNTNKQIPLNTFRNMISRVNKYKLERKSNPGKVFVKSGGVWYVTYTKFVEMLKRYVEYQKKYNKKPTVINVTSPSNKSAFHLMVEEHVGFKYNTFDEFFNKMESKGYAYYNNDIYPQGKALARIKANSGLNCSDYSQILNAVGEDLGEEMHYVHIKCINGGHIVSKRGTVKNGVIYDLAKKADKNSSYTGPGDYWCKSTGYIIGYDPSWLTGTDDGVT